MDRETWQAAVQGVTKSQTRLSTPVVLTSFLANLTPFHTGPRQRPTCLPVLLHLPVHGLQAVVLMGQSPDFWSQVVLGSHPGSSPY